MFKISEIKELIKSFDKSGLSKIKIASGEDELVMQKGGEAVTLASEPQAPQIAPAVQKAPVAIAPTTQQQDAPASVSGDTINSPMVGTFYTSPSPEASAFVKVGDKVKKGQTLCILEAMKIMNELEAEFDCKIVEILVNDGDPVEYDMPIFVVEKL